MRIVAWLTRVLVLLAVTAVLAEVTVRAWEAATGRRVALELAASLDLSESLYQPHPYVGYVLRPGATSQPGAIPFRVNALGFRGADFAAHKPPRTLRVACLGGSTTWGGGCSGDAATWPAVLETLLAKALPPGGPWDRVEVINAGVAGYTLMESFVNFKMRVLPLEPDIAIVYHGINDARVIGRGHFKPDYTHVRGPWRIPLPSAADALLGWSHLYGLVRGGEGERRDLFDVVYTSDFEELSMSDNIEAGAQTFARTLQELVAVARVNGCEPVLTTFTYTEELPVDRDWMLWFGFRTVDRLNKEAAGVAAYQGVTLVDLRAELGSDPSLFVDPVHFRDEGNARFAQVVARTLVDAGLLDGRPKARAVRAPPRRQ